MVAPIVPRRKTKTKNKISFGSLLVGLLTSSTYLDSFHFLGALLVPVRSESMQSRKHEQITKCPCGTFPRIQCRRVMWSFVCVWIRFESGRHCFIIKRSCIPIQANENSTFLSWESSVNQMMSVCVRVRVQKLPTFV